jgi:hypothetical protein
VLGASHALVRRPRPSEQDIPVSHLELCVEDKMFKPDNDFDQETAEKQASWLEKVLADEHERDKKHPDRIELPD